MQELVNKFGVLPEALEKLEENGTLEEWAARQEEAVARVESTLDNLVSAYYNMNEKIKASDEQSLASRISNIDANQTAVNTYAANLDAIAKLAQEKGVEINSRLWEELQAGTPESMDLTSDFLASIMSEDGTEWQLLNERFNAGLDSTLRSVTENFEFGEGANPAQAVLDSFSSTLAEDTTVPDAAVDVVDRAYNAATLRVPEVDFSTIGLNMMRGIENGIRSGTAGILAAMNDAIAKAHAAAQSIDEQHSPSQWWEKFGLNDMEGFALGIGEGAKLVQAA